MTSSTGNKVQTVWQVLKWQLKLLCQSGDLKSSTFNLEWRLKRIPLRSTLDVNFDASCLAGNYWGRPGNPSELRWGMRRAVMKTAISVRHKRPLQIGSGQLSSQNHKSTNSSLARWRERQSQIHSLFGLDKNTSYWFGLKDGEKYLFLIRDSQIGSRYHLKPARVTHSRPATLPLLHFSIPRLTVATLALRRVYWQNIYKF